MTYIDYINLFWKTSQNVKFSSNEAYLYFFLLSECNIRGWENPFECPNRRIILSIGISEPTLIDCRNRLQSKGLLMFESGKRNEKSPVYYLNDLSKQFSKTFSKRFSKDLSKNLSKDPSILYKTKEYKTIDLDNIPPTPPKGVDKAKEKELLEKEKALCALEEELKRYKKQLTQVDYDMTIAYKTVKELQDESTAELEESIANIEEINRKVRANLDKDKAEEDARTYQDQYTELTKKIESVRDEKTDLLNAADLPLPELSVRDGELVYKGQQWDNMSGSDRLKVSTAIVRKLNPKCGFVLLDKLEQMDLATLHEFGQWLEQEGLQAIATRVSTGDECSIIIEDGYVKSEETGNTNPEHQTAPTWKAGVF